MFDFILRIINERKWYLKKVMHSVEQAMWVEEFKIYSAAQIREGVRQDRDRQLDAQVNATKALAEEKDKERIAVITDDLKAIAENIARYDAQLNMIDREINGAPSDPTTGDPGEQGHNDNLAMLAARRDLYKEYLKIL